MQMQKPLIYWHWKIFLKGLLFCWVGGSDHSWKCKCDPFISIQQSRVKMMYSNTDLQWAEEEMAFFVKLSFLSWRILICPNLSNPSGSKKAPWQHYIITLISQCLCYASNTKAVSHFLGKTVGPAHFPKLISEEETELILLLKYLIMAAKKAAKCRQH